MLVSLSGSVEVLEVQEAPEAPVVQVASKVDENHPGVDQKKPHAERVMKFIFLQINAMHSLTLTMDGSADYTTGRTEIPHIGNPHNAYTMLAFSTVWSKIQHFYLETITGIQRATLAHAP